MQFARQERVHELRRSSGPRSAARPASAASWKRQSSTSPAAPLRGERLQHAPGAAGLAVIDVAADERAFRIAHDRAMRGAVALLPRGVREEPARCLPSSKRDGARSRMQARRPPRRSRASDGAASIESRFGGSAGFRLRRDPSAADPIAEPCDGSQHRRPRMPCRQQREAGGAGRNTRSQSRLSSGTTSPPSALPEALRQKVGRLADRDVLRALDHRAKQLRAGKRIADPDSPPSTSRRSPRERSCRDARSGRGRRRRSR